MTLFLERCLKVNATLNDVTASMIREFLSANEEEQLRQVRSWHANQFTFLGVKYDWVSRQRSISDKTLDKLQAARRCLVSISGEIAPRQLATLIGLLRYAAVISEAPAFDKFSLMAWTRRVGAYLQEDLKRWDERPMTFPDEYREELLSWFDVVLESSPVPIAVMLPSEVPTTIISDASGIGWGAVALYGNSHKTAQGRWPHEIQSSVAAEPKGVLQAVRQLVSTDEKIVLILTDHKPLVYASQSLAPRSFHYNNLLLHLRTEFPSTKFLFQSSRVLIMLPMR